MGAPLQIVKVLVRDSERTRVPQLDRSLLTRDPEDVLGDRSIDVVVETIGGVDAFVTADLRHHPASEHLAAPDVPALVDVSHWASEWPWCEQVAAILRDVLGGNVSITVSARCTDPWRFSG